MKRLSDQTLYEILEVPQDAEPAAIAAAYERARALYGPGSLATYTLMTSEESALLTSRIDEAKQTLLDAETRARYDASLATDAQGRPSAGENGAAATPFGVAAAPVIPAASPFAAEPGAGPATQPPTAAPEPPMRPADLLQAAAVAPPSAPIRLEREIAPAAPAPVACAAPPAEPEIPMPEGALWSGEALRRVREARGITLKQIAERTKVTRHHVENIEGERFSALPAPVYLRGILLSLARELRLDGQKVARAYLERAAGAADGPGTGRPR
jgi:curved DNA-binding protein CbpA